MARLVAAVDACVAVEFYATSLRISQRMGITALLVARLVSAGACVAMEFYATSLKNQSKE